MVENSLTLIDLIKKYNWTKGAELGVRRGDLSEALLKEVPNLHMTLVDLWKVSADHGILSLPGEEAGQMEPNMNITLAKMEPFKGRYTIVRELTTEAALKIPNKSLDFVFIDATHTYDHLMADINAWKDKVKDDGIICGHDYHPSFDEGGMIRGVKEAFSDNYYVDDYTCWFGWKKDLKI